MAVTRHPFQPAPPPDRRMPKAIACLQGVLEGIAPGAASVLIIGERGTRKEMAARCVHALSTRAQGPFVSMSRPELTEEFVEWELFGCEGLAAEHRGRLAEAEGGTLFLDEVCDFSLATQARLARALDARRADCHQEGGGVRLLAASEREPAAAIAGQWLHPGLYDLLRVFIVRVPPLRERKGDILDLAHDFIASHAQAKSGAMPRLSSAAISRLIAYHWPGNVRELEQCIDHAVGMAAGGLIDECHLPADIAGAQSGAAPQDEDEGSLLATLESVERALIEEALRASHGNQAKAAQRLGITERLMGLRVKKYAIESRHFRHGASE